MICPGTTRECDSRGCRYGGCQGRYPLAAIGPPLVACSTCGGTGTVAHQKRRLGTEADAPIDPLDHQTVELCPKCSGSGSVVAPRPGA